MKRKLLLTANIIGLFLILFVIIAGRISYSTFIQSFSKSIPDSSAIGIIVGGTDGPTAIFASGNFDLNTTALLLLLPLLLVGILLISNFVYLKKLRIGTTPSGRRTTTRTARDARSTPTSRPVA